MKLRKSFRRHIPSWIFTNEDEDLKISHSYNGSMSKDGVIQRNKDGEFSASATPLRRSLDPPITMGMLFL